MSESVLALELTTAPMEVSAEKELSSAEEIPPPEFISWISRRLSLSVDVIDCSVVVV
jgi:hypothetical protein